MYQREAPYRSQNNRAYIVLDVTQLLRTIETYAYTQALALKKSEEQTEDVERYRAMLKDIAQDDNISMVSRWMEIAFGECGNIVASYDKRPTAGSSASDNKQDWHDEYILYLNVPKTFPMATLNALTQQMHEYVCCRVLQEYTSILLPSVSETWANKAVMHEQAISDMAKARTKMPLIRTNDFI